MEQVGDDRALVLFKARGVVIKPNEVVAFFLGLEHRSYVTPFELAEEQDEIIGWLLTNVGDPCATVSAVG